MSSPPPLMSPVAGARKPLVSKRVLGIAVGAVVVMACGVTYWRVANPPPVAMKAKLPDRFASTVPYEAPTMPLPTQKVTFAPVAAPRPQTVATPDPAKPIALPNADPLSFNLRQATAGAVGRVSPAERKPHMITYAPPPARPGDETAPRPDAPAVTYATSHFTGQQAVLQGDQTFILQPGLISCVLDTAVNSTFPGPIICHTKADIKPHGVTLLDRGSMIQGTYTNVVGAGQSRLFIAADSAFDPVSSCGVQFAKDPIADPSGVTGAEGNVDPHWFDRFGAAFLLTGAQEAGSIAQSALSRSGNTYLSLGNSGGGGGGVQSLASEILRAQVGQPPTITLNPGTEIAVFLTRPLDFHKCYDLQLRK